jgi:hypothetical protein
MGLVLFAILFLFGAIGMERRRGLGFSTMTGVLLFAWVLPLTVQQTWSLGIAYILLAATGLLIAALLLSMGFYLAGRMARIIFTHIRSGRTD